MTAKAYDWSKLSDILDMVCTAKDLNEALFMAVEHSSVTKTATGALQSVSAELDNRLGVIKDALSELMEEAK
jgi:hypothetical protein